VPRSSFAGVEVIVDDEERLLQWHFPYTDSSIDPDREMQLGLFRYSFDKGLDARERKTVEQLESLPLDIPVRDDGYLRIEDLDRESGDLVVAHIPSAKWESLKSGIVFRFTMGAIMDDEYQRYGPHGESANGGPDRIWIENVRLSPVNMNVIEHLVFIVQGAEFSWHYLERHHPGDEDDDVSLVFRIPLRSLQVNLD